MDEQQGRNEKIRSLAGEVLLLSRNKLLVNLRFLDMALSRFTHIPVLGATLLTDARHIYYDPVYVLTRYRKEQEVTTRDYLHMVMHCVFRHMYTDPSLNRSYWDLACDIAVENVISELGLKIVTAEREKEQQNYIDSLKKELRHITAEKIYSHLRRTMPDEAEIAQVRKLFYADDHRTWYMTGEAISEQFGLGGSGGSSSEDSENGPQNAGQENDGSSAQSEAAAKENACKATADIWKDIAEKMQMDLETFSKDHGDTAGSLLQGLTAVNREKYDYTDFLKKFASLGEVMKINDDEFNYIYYTYGLKLYEKMPLIEPLEYKEVKRIKEFVIAIDTSGSVSGELVQSFVEKTYNILKSTESFFAKINLHIIQCDAKVQEHIKITDQAEFDRYLAEMQIHGLGGTDFRPVFQMVDELIRKKEFQNLKGLIYFTDGRGDFPAQKPDYDTAFVFVEDEYNNPEVPPWAIKLVLQSEEIN